MALRRPRTLKVPSELECNFEKHVLEASAKDVLRQYAHALAAATRVTQKKILALAGVAADHLVALARVAKQSDASGSIHSDWLLSLIREARSTLLQIYPAAATTV